MILLKCLGPKLVLAVPKLNSELQRALDQLSERLKDPIYVFVSLGDFERSSKGHELVLVLSQLKSWCQTSGVLSLNERVSKVKIQPLFHLPRMEVVLLSCLLNLSQTFLGLVGRYEDLLS